MLQLGADRVLLLQHTHINKSSYQIEGAPEADGRGPSIWDVYCKQPGKIADGSCGAVACDSYNRTAEDIELLKSCGAQAYRFSLSWSRIIPLGGRNDPVNQAGLDHYVKFTKDLLAAGIMPLVTLFHWDLPQGIEERYGGMLNKKEFVPDFVNYARVVFQALAPYVKYFVTFNEPWCSAVLGYNSGIFAPGRTSDRSKSKEGNSATECWIVGHSILVAHGAAVKVFREEFKPKHGGEISIVINGDWGEPWDSESEEDMVACERKLEFSIGWFADPIYHGDYPASMREQLGDRLPKWEDEEISLVRGSNDFYGMNTYCANYIRHRTTTADKYDVLGNLEILFENKQGKEIGPVTQSAWLRPCSAGFRNLLIWISKRNDGPRILVTENRTSIKNENDLGMPEILEDDFRVQYYKGMYSMKLNRAHDI